MSGGWGEFVLHRGVEIVHVTGTRIVIGRSESCELTCVHSGVSRRHCTIQIGAHGVEVVDNSRYGTRLNGHEIDGAAILQSGDVLSLGNPVSEFLLISEVTESPNGA